jgi:plastocyanin
MRGRAIAFVSGLGLVAALSAPAAAAIVGAHPFDPAGAAAIVAVPGSREATYATPVMVVDRGDELSFVNAEPFAHSVRSEAFGPDDVPWCQPWDPHKPQHRVRNPRQFPRGKCPLLWSLSITMTTGAVQTKVYGTKNLKPGSSIEFYCTVFPDMRGTLIVR